MKRNLCGISAGCLSFWVLTPDLPRERKKNLDRLIYVEHLLARPWDTTYTLHHRTAHASRVGYAPSHHTYRLGLSPVSTTTSGLVE